ncbi:DMT family transporter [Saccharopolyspora taberi]|uniref:DMT family transporter n=1 Tax=Saccharopolyspora taberi TaxID=60895 RepID=A0ABN3VBT7_9PSEU
MTLAEDRPTTSSPPRWVRVVLPVAFILIWSSGYLAGTIGAHAGAQLALVFWRFFIAFLLLGAVSLATRAPWPTRPRTYLHLLVIGVLLQTVQLGGVYLGLGLGVPAGLSSLIICSAPLIVAAAGVPLFGERLTGIQWAGLGIGLVGVGISLSGSISGGGNIAGYALTGVSLLGLAGGTLYQKGVGVDVDLRTGTTIQLLGSSATSLLLALAQGSLAIPLNPAALGSLAWLASVNSIGGLLLLFLLLRQRSGGAATSLLYLVPPVTALIAVPLLGQGITAGVFAGMAVSGVGVFLVNRRSA